MNLMCDVTSNCNLRCPFCVNDWPAIGTENINMTPETWAGLIEQARSPEVEYLFVSCGFEPLLHPQLPELLMMIPPELRAKCFISTNLSLPLTDAHLQAFTAANLSYINVSLESFRSTVYQSLRKGAKFKTFIENLERLVAIREAAADPPDLRFIVMALRQNVGELPAIVKRCLDYGASLVEIRQPFGYSHKLMPPEFRESSLLDDEALAVLQARIPTDPRIFWRMEAGRGKDLRVNALGEGAAIKPGLNLNLGCGEHPKAGYVNIDIRDLPTADLVADWEAGLPYESESVDSIAAYHVLEHLRDVPCALREAWRVLKTGALIEIHVPLYQIWQKDHLQCFYPEWFKRNIGSEWQIESEDIYTAQNDREEDYQEMTVILRKAGGSA